MNGDAGPLADGGRPGVSADGVHCREGGGGGGGDDDDDDRAATSDSDCALERSPSRSPFRASLWVQAGTAASPESVAVALPEPVCVQLSDVQLQSRCRLEELFTRWLSVAEVPAQILHMATKLAETGTLADDEVELAPPKPSTSRLGRASAGSATTTGTPRAVVSGRALDRDDGERAQSPLAAYEEHATLSLPQSPVSNYMRLRGMFLELPHLREGEALLDDAAVVPSADAACSASPTQVDAVAASPPCEERAAAPMRTRSGRAAAAAAALSSAGTKTGIATVSIPRFYFPCGKTPDSLQRAEDELRAIEATFRRVGTGLGQRETVELILDVVGLPSFFSVVIFERLLERQKRQRQASVTDRLAERTVDRATFLQWYREACAGFDKHARLFHALLDSRQPTEAHTPPPSHTGSVNGDDEHRLEAKHARHARDYLVPSDFRPFIEALLATHPGLQFLQSTPEFQHRYAETAVERIFYALNRPEGRIYLADLRHHRVIDTLMEVDEEDDINVERRFLSYEHFYVLYCRFWELDTDHDLMVDREDLLRYGGHALTYRVVERIFSGRGRPLDCKYAGHMSYTDFIWFALSEEDKSSDTALDYWFRCVDGDGDGIITLHDVDWLYSEQLHRMECLGHEPVASEDILCQLLDMLSPHMNPPLITKATLRASRLQSNFFNTLFNLNKFIALESRDPALIRQEHATPELNDWDRFAAIEYLRLSAEDGDDTDNEESNSAVMRLAGSTGNSMAAGDELDMMHVWHATDMEASSGHSPSSSSSSSSFSGLEAPF
ncbi:hypothetical protein CDCA_CDCA08G2291 [Cyanidium caldarium]|uniref:EF-hand domain-containing protein n=1 Tax=Cyanidium caldarium TaxID=2771 RepID=A0AAV9IVY7_CYACA|nr:hypothetical protein CDCA_CDCA08G2291 [Cyanidium caldarium]